MNHRRPSARDRRERPRALGLDLGRADRFDRQARGPQRLGDLAGSHPPVGHAERHQDRGAHRHPGGEREDQLHRQHRAGEQPRHGDQEQREPGGPAPRPAQPGRGGHDHRRRARDQRRAGERGAGQPRAVREVVRERGRVLAAEQERRSRPRSRRRPPPRRPARPAAGTGGCGAWRRPPGPPRPGTPPVRGRS